MPLLILLLIALLIVQFGFWDTLAGVLGAAAVVVLALITLGALAAASVFYFYRKMRHRLR